MAPRWTYPVIDVRTGTQVHPDLPINVDDFTDNLGVGDGTLRGKIPVRSGMAYDVDDVTDPWRRAIIPCRNGQPRGAYVFTGEAPFTSRSTDVSVVGTRIDTLFYRREVWSTLVFRQVDQLVIARNLMAYALGLTPINVDALGMGALITLLPPQFRVPWLKLDNSFSGQLRDRLDNPDGYQAATHKNIGEELTKLTRLDGGFDYRLRYDRDPVTSALSATVELGYPDFSETPGDVMLEHPGRNVLDFTTARDGDDVITAARGYGAGTGTDKVYTDPVYSTRAAAAGLPGLVKSVTTTASELDTITRGARATLDANDYTNGGVLLKLNPRLIGRVPLGAVLPVVIHDDRRWRSPFRATVRVVGHKIEPSRPGRAEAFTPSLVRID